MLPTSWCAVAWTNEQGVRRFHYHKIIDADGGNEFRSAPEKIAGGIEGVRVAGQMLSPGCFRKESYTAAQETDIAPADLGGDDKNRR